MSYIDLIGRRIIPDSDPKLISIARRKEMVGGLSALACPSGEGCDKL
jgi:hypothetical protein